MADNPHLWCRDKGKKVLGITRIFLFILGWKKKKSQIDSVSCGLMKSRHLNGKATLKDHLGMKVCLEKARRGFFP